MANKSDKRVAADNAVTRKFLLYGTGFTQVCLRCDRVQAQAT